ncbi:hypothetical protein PWT90_04131 [Aphanocladium album]|nr:hypothetical protein PWT90_04131 [Aphanocladium album]
MEVILSTLPAQVAAAAANLSGSTSPILRDCHRRVEAFLLILTWQNILLASVLGTVVYIVALVIYRLFYSPVAAFPGPFLAKVTHWYEFYHNFIRTGMYYEEIRKMHERYGMRFSNGTGFEGYQYDANICAKFFVANDIGSGRYDSDFDYPRSSPASPSTVGQAVFSEWHNQSFQGSGQVVNLTDAFSSLTTDIISSIIFEEPSDYLGDPNFNKEWYETLKMVTLHGPLTAKQKARCQVMLILKRPSDKSKSRDETTVLDHLVHSDLVERELGNGGFARLAQLIQQAGAHNVSHTLSTIFVHLHLDGSKLELLRQELGEAWRSYDDAGTEPTWLELEKLSYLSACIAEGLRMAIGGMNRTPRVFPHEEVKVCDWSIPKGTPVSMSTYWMHNDASVFVNPDQFNPDRWLNASSEQLRTMRSRFVPFAKGSRSCVGQNLVYMQLFHTLARLFRPKSAQFLLQDTTLRDIIAVHGLLFPMPPFDTNGVQVTIF